MDVAFLTWITISLSYVGRVEVFWVGWTINAPVTPSVYCVETMVRHWREFKEADSIPQRNVSTHNLMALSENHVEMSRGGHDTEDADLRALRRVKD